MLTLFLLSWYVIGLITCGFLIHESGQLTPRDIGYAIMYSFGGPILGAVVFISWLISVIEWDYVIWKKQRADSSAE